MYDADLSSDTLTRVTQGFEGQRTEAPERQDETGSPSFSGDGLELAFSSADDDLVYGDGNEAADGFVVPRIAFAPVPTPQEISPAPEGPALAPSWAITATAASRRDGTVLLYVQVPGAGSLAAVGPRHGCRHGARR